jgi:hypothetical protein
MKNATATSHGNNRFAESLGATGGAEGSLGPAEIISKNPRPSLRGLDYISSGRISSGLVAAGIFDCFLHDFPGLPRALLNPPDQFIVMPLGVLQIIIRQVGPFLFQFALRDVPIAFYFECGHNVSLSF